MSKRIFLRELMKNCREVGAVAPSSPFLVRKMLSKIDFETVRLVVELGPGTGAMTKEILSQLHPEGRLVALESNETFYSMLRNIHDHRLSAKRISATELSRILAGEKSDAIVSGLPLAVIDRKVVGKILEEVQKNLAPGGVFVQFQYSLASRRAIEGYFQKVNIDFVPINLPPAFVYSARVCNTKLLHD